MAQIFVAHSSQDRDLVDFFSRAFAPTGVKPILESLARLTGDPMRACDVARSIENSSAVFVVASVNVGSIPRTRDWVLWESGVGKSKDIWVFEPLSQLGTIAVVVPYLRHYVLFDTSEAWGHYITQIIDSYDNSQALPMMLSAGLAGLGLGAALDESSAGGAIAMGIGASVLGLVMSDKSASRPMGIGVLCPLCHASYSAHIPRGLGRFRCPACNTPLQVSGNC